VSDGGDGDGGDSGSGCIF
ncbi:unnamed protein product, partial [Rotaria socialis]